MQTPWLQPIKRVPLVQSVRRERALRFFLSSQGAPSHFGVFDSFDAARRFLPPSREFDDAVLADEYVRVRCKQVFPYDYPVMWWLEQAFRQGASSVFDIGGSVGVHFHAYRRYLAYPAALRWRVVEVPAIARLGRELTAAEDAQALRFTSDFETAHADEDIWLAAGSLHYIEDADRIGAWLAYSARPPRYLLLNKLPLYGGESFVSTQNIGEGDFAPHHVWNRARFIAGIEAAGYRLVDGWDVPERGFELFDDASRSFRAYAGLYFERRE